MLLKIAYFNSANRQLSNAAWSKELRQRKIVDPSRGASLSSVERNFSVFIQKIRRAVIFYLLANPAETAYLSVRDGKLSNAVRIVEFRQGKVCSSHLVGLFPSGAAQTAFAPDLSKAITFLS